MRDEPLMKTTVSAIEGSRFASTSLASENITNAVSGPVTRTLPSRFAATLAEDSLVVDDRSHLTPAQMVESKLISRLKESSLPVSHLQMRGLVRNRYES
jgi:hypothetical protein